jgi:hypothetical protein
LIRWLATAILSPFLKLGEKYLDNEKDRQKLEHGTTRVAYEADAAVRKVKLGTLLGILPLFIAEVSCSIYLAAIFLDSTWASDLINPLELPEWFKPHFYIIVASIFGISTFERVAKRRQ